MIRCAIYTRKSTEERLDMRFNSLEAQADACRAYIASQAHAGWQCTEEEYQDPGYSAGSLKRPAMERMLEKVRRNAVDVVVVHKVDRLTRSLIDFANLAELFEQHGVSFVSVTQHLDTSTSMGRLSLNVLLSFAQFEREIASERIKEKIHASRKRGLWTGGRVPLGYRCVDKKLVIDENTAPVVRKIFSRYQTLQNVTDLRLQWQSGRSSKLENSRDTNFPAPSRGAIYTVLRNPVYIGKVRCGAQLVDGIHRAIVKDEVWHSVQTILDGNTRNRRDRCEKSPSLSLLGKLFDEDGKPLTRSHTRKKNGSRYNYYVSADSTRNTRKPATIRIPCARLERLVIDRIFAEIDDAEKRIEWAEDAGLTASAVAMMGAWQPPKSQQGTDAVALSLVERVEIRDGFARIKLVRNRFLDLVAGRQQCSGTGLNAIQIDATDSILTSRIKRSKNQIIRPRKVNDQQVNNGKKWFAMLATGRARNMDEIAEAYGVSQATVSRTIAKSLEF